MRTRAGRPLCFSAHPEGPTVLRPVCFGHGQRNVSFSAKSTEGTITNSSEGEAIAAYGAVILAAFQVLINCLEESDALLPGRFPEALGVYMELVGKVETEQRTR